MADRAEIETSLVDLEKEWILTPVKGLNQVLDFYIVEGDSVETSFDDLLEQVYQSHDSFTLEEE